MIQMGSDILMPKSNPKRGRVEPFTLTSLWSHLAAREPDPFAKDREWLRTSFERMREAVEPLAAELARSVPHFTDHSIAHLDALWEMGSIVAGEEYPITPAEVYVLGCAFLLHDLGMGLAAYPGGQQEIEQSPQFSDAMTLIRDANSALSEEQVHSMALTQHLRRQHAKQAGKLVDAKFSHAGHEIQLMEDQRLKSHFGHLIGLIAESHWYDVEELPARLGRFGGARGPLPAAWTIDPMKVALLLRLADAAQLDSRRAPLFLHTYRKPLGHSEDHWLFQERMAKPIVAEDRLQYISTSPFTVDESAAWWVAYDSIKMVDKELRQADALCADLRIPRMRVRSVAGIESPSRFSEYVQTRDWTPIDASLRVTKVRDLIQRLGGKTLYGDEPLVALRELISNGADAVRARRVQFENSGLKVEVRLELRGEEWLLRVRDNGLGMSPDQMIRYLTDFGNSQWLSQERVDEFPGLATKGFKATGKFGIGFFSVFMVADRVTVLSVPVKGGPRDTHLLDFPDGLRSRPLIRKATEDEQLDGPGTEVRLILRNPPMSTEGLFSQFVSRYTPWELLEVVLCEMCFLLDVDLYVGDEEGKTKAVVKGNEWKSLDAAQLYSRLYLQPARHIDWWERAMFAAFEPLFVANLEDIYDDEGDIIGRAALAAGLEELVASDQWWWPSPRAHVYVGGIKTDHIYNILGVLVGAPRKADRSAAFPVASPDKLKAWATSQAAKSGNAVYATPTTRYDAGQLAMSLGVVAADLPCAFSKNGMLTPQELDDWIAPLDEVFLINRYSVMVFHDDARGTVVAEPLRYRVIDLPAECLIVEPWVRWLYPDEVLKRPKDERFLPERQLVPDDWDPSAYWYDSYGTNRLILEAAARAWGEDVVELGKRTETLSQTEHRDSRLALNCIEGGSVRIEAARISRRGQALD